MAEHSYGVEIPQEVVRHPFLQQAGKTSAIAIAFANDIIGLKADLLRGIRDNLVLSLQEEYGGDLQQNVERAAAHFHRAAAEFSALQAASTPPRACTTQTSTDDTTSPSTFKSSKTGFTRASNGNSWTPTVTARPSDSPTRRTRTNS